MYGHSRYAVEYGAASHALEKEVSGILRNNWKDHVARLIAELVHVGALSWARDTNVTTEWRKTLADVCASSCYTDSTSLIKRG